MLLRKFSIFTYSLLLMLGILVSITSNVFAEVQKPEKLAAQGQGYIIDSVLYAYVDLNWMNPDSADGFNFYISYTKTDNYDDFELLQTINYPNDSLIQHKDNYWTAYLTHVDSHNQEVLYFYIKAFKGRLVSDPSNISYCYVRTKQPEHSISFTTTPPLTSKLNEEYSYKFDVKTDLENAIIDFEFLSKPTNAKLDKENKTVTFTPTKGGIYSFNLMASAYDAAGTKVQTNQYWELRVIECDKPSTISGKITDEDGNNILWCYAILYMKSDSTQWDSLRYVAQMTFENGEYSFTGLDKGILLPPGLWL